MSEGPEKKKVAATEGEIEVTDEQLVKHAEKVEALGKAHKAAGTVIDKAELPIPDKK